MNRNAITLSLLMAVAAVFFLKERIDSIELEQKRKFGSEVLVVKAQKDIKEQETILEDMVTLVKIPKAFLEPAAVSIDRSEVSEENEEDEEISDERKSKLIKSIIGTVAVVPIRKDEQITRNKLTEPNIRTGLAPQVSPKRRAIAIPVNDISGVAKLVKPGDRVDLIAVIDLGGEKTNKIAKTVLQDVTVLATGRRITNNVARTIEADPVGGKDKIRSLAEDFSFNTVTLEVDPLQAQMIALILAGGDSALSLVLRNSDDMGFMSTQASSYTFKDLLGPDAGMLQQRAPAGQVGGRK
jgi:pilus assembly protein CpaB